MFAIVCGQNHMSRSDVTKECQVDKWIPILVMRPHTGGGTIVPLFVEPTVALRFRERNLPKDWLCGVMAIQMDDAKFMDDKGLKAITYDFPRHIKNFVDFDVEVVEFPPDRELQIH